MAFLASLIPSLISSPLIRDTLGTAIKNIGGGLWSGIKQTVSGLASDVIDNAKSSANTFLEKSTNDLNRAVQPWVTANKTNYKRRYTTMEPQDREVDEEGDYEDEEEEEPVRRPVKKRRRNRRR